MIQLYQILFISTSLSAQIIGEKDADGFYWGECGGMAGFVPCNMISEVQVDDERVARELLKVRIGSLLVALTDPRQTNTRHDQL